MLVLTRKTGESIWIDDCIKLTVTSIGPNKVRIGVVAPAHIRVDREEVRRRMAVFAEAPVAEQELAGTSH
jgi:carbon storage regulator